MHVHMYVRTGEATSDEKKEQKMKDFRALLIVGPVAEQQQVNTKEHSTNTGPCQTRSYQF